MDLCWSVLFAPAGSSSPWSHQAMVFRITFQLRTFCWICWVLNLGCSACQACALLLSYGPSTMDPHDGLFCAISVHYRGGDGAEWRAINKVLIFLFSRGGKYSSAHFLWHNSSWPTLCSRPSFENKVASVWILSQTVWCADNFCSSVRYF